MSKVDLNDILIRHNIGNVAILKPHPRNVDEDELKVFRNDLIGLYGRPQPGVDAFSHYKKALSDDMIEFDERSEMHNLINEMVNFPGEYLSENNSDNKNEVQTARLQRLEQLAYGTKSGDNSMSHTVKTTSNQNAYIKHEGGDASSGEGVNATYFSEFAQDLIDVCGTHLGDPEATYKYYTDKLVEEGISCDDEEFAIEVAFICEIFSEEWNGPTKLEHSVRERLRRVERRTRGARDAVRRVAQRARDAVSRGAENAMVNAANRADNRSARAGVGTRRAERNDRAFNRLMDRADRIAARRDDRRMRREDRTQRRWERRDRRDGVRHENSSGENFDETLQHEGGDASSGDAVSNLALNVVSIYAMPNLSEDLSDDEAIAEAYNYYADRLNNDDVECQEDSLLELTICTLSTYLADTAEIAHHQAGSTMGRVLGGGLRLNRAQLRAGVAQELVRGSRNRRNARDDIRRAGRQAVDGLLGRNSRRQSRRMRSDINRMQRRSRRDANRMRAIGAGQADAWRQRGNMLLNRIRQSESATSVQNAELKSILSHGQWYRDMLGRFASPGVGGGAVTGPSIDGNAAPSAQSSGGRAAPRPVTGDQGTRRRELEERTADVGRMSNRELQAALRRIENENKLQQQLDTFRQNNPTIAEREAAALAARKERRAENRKKLVKAAGFKIPDPSNPTKQIAVGQLLLRNIMTAAGTDKNTAEAAAAKATDKTKAANDAAKKLREAQAAGREARQERDAANRAAEEARQATEEANRRAEESFARGETAGRDAANDLWQEAARRYAQQQAREREQAQQASNPTDTPRLGDGVIDVDDYNVR